MTQVAAYAADTNAQFWSATVLSSPERDGFNRVLRGALETCSLVASPNEVDHHEQEGERIRPQPEHVRRVDRRRARLHLVQGPPPAHGHVDDRHVDGAEDADRGAPLGAALWILDEGPKGEVPDE